MGTEETTKIPAAGYIRVSTNKQSKGFGPDVQRAEIEAYAGRMGFVVTQWYEDVEKGRNIGRSAYQEIRAAVKAGVIHAVIVFTFDRAGRDSDEFSSFARALQKKRVPFHSVKEGKDEPGIMRGVYGGMAEEEAKKIARRVTPAKIESVKAGNHIGITPFGYMRPDEIPIVDGRPGPRGIFPVEPAASIVRELFDRAALGWPLRDLAVWMNANPECPRPRMAESWTADRVGYILHNPVYYGAIRYNAHSVGFYERCEPGSMFITPGKHGPLVSKEVFDKVQERIGAALHVRVRARMPGPLPLAAGLLVCAGCGGPMTLSRRVDGTHADQYLCSNGRMGAAPCRAVAYLTSLAHDALLAQLTRLMGAPWEPQALDRVREADPTADERAFIQGELRAARVEQARHVRRYAAATEDLTPEEVLVFREIGGEIQARIDALVSALDALPLVTLTDSGLQDVHHELTHMPLGEVVSALAGTGDTVALRALVLKLVGRAQVVDRAPATRSRWLRVEVTWTRSVQVLLDAGLLTLAPDVARPDYPDNPLEARKARQRAYYHRTKARAS